MSVDKLPEWPEMPDVVYADNCFPPTAQAKFTYERARAEAAIARLSVAVEALQRLSLGDERWNADEALTAIGDLPHD